MLQTRSSGGTIQMARSPGISARTTPSGGRRKNDDARYITTRTMTTVCARTASSSGAAHNKLTFVAIASAAARSVAIDVERVMRFVTYRNAHVDIDVHSA